MVGEINDGSQALEHGHSRSAHASIYNRNY